VRAVKFDGSTIGLTATDVAVAAAPGEAVVRPSRVLITAADMIAAGLGAGEGGGGAAPETQPGAHAFKGVLGSQYVGVVKEINLPPDAGAAMLSRKGWVGKRVVGTPAIPCTSCDLCRTGLSAHCRARTVLGVHQRDGCLAEAFTVPLSSLCPVPDAVVDDAAVFAYTLSSALHAANMLRGEHTSFITVLGDSAMAMLTAQVLARMNKSVRLLTSKPDRQRLCERWGIKHRGVDEPGRRQDQDVVVDCTGTSGGLRLALQLVRPRGIVLLKSPSALAPFPPGRPMPMVRAGAGSSYAEPVDLTPAIVNEVQILGSRDGPMPDALRMLAEKAVDVSGLIVKRVKLEEVPAAMRGVGLAAGGAAGGAAVQDMLGLLVEV